MKRFFYIIYIISAILLGLLLYSCGNGNRSEYKVNSQGSPYEIILVATNHQWEGELGDTLRSVILEPVDFINQREPMYDLSRILPGNFNGLITKHRNIILIKTGEECREPAMTASYDIHAAPQIIVTLSGPDDKAITEYVSTYRKELQATFEITERERTVNLNNRYGDRRIAEEINKMFGFEIAIPKGYNIRNTIPSKDFMWISFEYPRASQGILIYSYPYTDKDDFTVERLTERRNEFAALVPGELENSYMTTYDEFIPEIKHLQIYGRYWAELRGFWEVANDFMGGPFVSFSTLDAENNRVVTLDCYVYSPDKPKRNFMRLLEHIIYTVSFPGDNPKD